MSRRKRKKKNLKGRGDVIVKLISAFGSHNFGWRKYIV